MDVMMTSSSKKASSNSRAAGSDHHHGRRHQDQQEAMGTAPLVVEARNVRQARQRSVSRREHKPRLQEGEALKCPCCNSNSTKFAYYNNYNLSQPRYFCKACSRYWTHGGCLRNIPVGSGCRKNKSSHASLSPSSSSSSSFTSINQQLQQHLVPASLTAEQDFSNMLPTFMPNCFELPQQFFFLKKRQERCPCIKKNRVTV